VQQTVGDRVVAFYSGGVDDRGRRIEEIWRWSDLELERVHDYIQWLFPTVQPSAVNPSAPLVTEKTRERFQADASLREALRRSLDRLLAFYGLRRSTMGTTTHIEIDPKPFERSADNWLTPGNHNHVRLTRIMQSLASLGLSTEARALQRCLLDEVFPGPGRERITNETHRFWLRALAAEAPSDERV
jgi:Opioid growth factor receptor (OGFr) conserved region